MCSNRYDVVIIGGGIIGSAIACFLAEKTEFQGSILVVEQDLSYSKCSTSLSVGGVRQQFSTPENIEMSKFGAEYFQSVTDRLSVTGEKIDISFVQAGYLFLASQIGLPLLQQNVEIQKRHGVNVLLLDADALSKQFPWLNTTDLSAGSGSLGIKNEGWIDPFALLQGFIQKAKYLGVNYLQDTVTGLQKRQNRIHAVQLQKEGAISCGWVINAAGVRAAQIAKMAGIHDFPVHPRKRQVFVFETKDPIHNCPLVIDPTGVYFRPEGDKFICGLSPPADEDPDCFDFTVDHQYFYDKIWQILAHRVPQFDAIKLTHAWAGHYAYNSYDQNAILGIHPEIHNFVLANGFSGHGLQQSPAVGRAISELITTGTYQTLDLSRFQYERFANGNLVKEQNVI